jgi:hypothetical protein
LYIHNNPAGEEENMKKDYEITPEEVNGHMDILCGREKSAYSNIGNRRFRFLAAFNVERYRSTGSGRKGKSLVIQSIYNQIRETGCRFLIRQSKEPGACFVEVSEVFGREKTSHALRDKSPPCRHLKDVELKKLRLEISCQDRFGDEVFVAANAYLLRIDILHRMQPMAAPQSNRAHDNRVDLILSEELEIFCVQAAERRRRSLQGQEHTPIAAVQLSHDETTHIIGGGGCCQHPVDSAYLSPPLCDPDTTYQIRSFDKSFWRTGLVGTTPFVYSPESGDVNKKKLVGALNVGGDSTMPTMDDFFHHEGDISDFEGFDDVAAPTNTLSVDDCQELLGDMLDFAAAI